MLCHALIHLKSVMWNADVSLCLEVSAGMHHSAALSASGVLFTWGRGSDGRLGHGGISHEYKPRAVKACA